MSDVHSRANLDAGVQGCSFLVRQGKNKAWLLSLASVSWPTLLAVASISSSVPAKQEKKWLSTSASLCTKKVSICTCAAPTDFVQALQHRLEVLDFGARKDQAQHFGCKANKLSRESPSLLRAWITANLVH